MGGAEEDFVFESECARSVEYDKKEVLRQAGVHKNAGGNPSRALTSIAKRIIQMPTCLSDKFDGQIGEFLLKFRLKIF